MGSGNSTIAAWRATQRKETELASHVVLACKDALAEFEASEFSGTVLLPGRDEAYHTVRTDTFNYAAQGVPALIMQPRTAEDVAAAVGFAKKHNLDVCVSGGKHSFLCMVTGSLVIDLHAHMSEVHVDADKRLVRVGGGAKLGMMDAELAPHRLIVPTGTNPDTGVGGLTLSGGWGWVARRLGMSIDSLVELQVVLTSGEIVVVNKDSEEHKDLWWALRGGSGTFGIVAEFTFKCHPQPEVVVGTVVSLAPTLAASVQVAQNFAAWATAAPRTVTSALALLPGAPVMPALMVHTSDETPLSETSPKPGRVAADAMPEEFKEVARTGFGGWMRVANTWEHKDYFDVQKMMEEHQAAAFTAHGALFLTDVTPEAIERIVYHARYAYPLRSSVAGTMMLLTMMGGATEDEPEEGSALDRRAKSFIVIEGVYPAGNEQKRMEIRAWTRAMTADLAKLGVVLETTHTDEKDGIAQTDPGLRERLRAIKQKYDPDNVLSLNSGSKMFK